MINVMIVDDQALVRNGLAMIVDSQDDLSVVAEADSGDSALILAKRLAVDVVLMDVCMPGTDGIETTSRLIESEPSPRVIIVTTFDIDKYVFGALRAGASGFIVKSARAEDVIAAIRTVHAAMRSSRLVQLGGFSLRWFRIFRDRLSRRRCSTR